MTLGADLLAALRGEVTVYPDRAAWLADARRGPPDWSIGGTTAADITGAGFRGPWAAWLAGQDGGDPIEPTARMANGSEWEPLVLRWYAGHHGRPVLSPLCRVAHRAAPWLRVSPDGFARDSLDGWGLLEIKCPGSRDGWGTDGHVVHRADVDALRLMPPGYLVQVYAGLAATGLPWCDVVACFGPQDTRTIRVLADAAHQARLLADLADWRDVHLVRSEPPEPDDSDDCFRALYREAREGVRPATPEEADHVVAYARARSEKQEAEARQRREGAAILASMGTTRTITVDLGRGAPARFTAGARAPVLTGLE